MVDVVHGPVVAWGSAESDDAMNAADYLVAVKVGNKVDDPVTVRVLLKAPLKPLPTTNLRDQKVAPPGAVLLPEVGEMLQVIHPDATAAYCVNVGGRWIWYAPAFTAAS